MQKSTNSLTSRKQKILEIERQRKCLIRFLLSDCEVIEGSFIDVKVRCGRSGCHCENEPLHPVTRLSWWDNGKLKNKIIRVADRVWVKKLSDNYKKHRQAMRDLVRLNEKEKEIIKSVVKLKTRKYE